MPVNLCNNHQFASETMYFQHMGKNLRNHELVSCMFNGWSYKQIYIELFTSIDTPYTSRDFKPEAIYGCLWKMMMPVIQLKLASVLLKLEHSYLVPNAAVNEGVATYNRYRLFVFHPKDYL